MADTIFALSSGAPPAAICVLRISGPGSSGAIRALCGNLPPPRRASLRLLRGESGALLDHALVLWFPGPGTATGEDLAELHCHGGRAVVAAIERELGLMAGLRRAEPGEFTRRAFANGCIDLAEAEGLADLLEAETELQRANALAMARGAVSRQVETWREEVLGISAAVEAVLDFADEDDAASLPDDFSDRRAALGKGIGAWLARPAAEALREGFRVVLAGPPNAGKSTIFNALVEVEAAITSDIAGTTRDVLSRPVSLEGIPFVFLDTAGLRETASDEIESIGIARAHAAVRSADLVLWLGPEGEGPEGSWEIEAQADRAGHAVKASPRHRVSAVTGLGMDGLRSGLVEVARAALPRPGEAALNARQRLQLAIARDEVDSAAAQSDPLLVAENLRRARAAFDALIGRTTTEDMLDALFGRFCIGK